MAARADIVRRCIRAVFGILQVSVCEVEQPIAVRRKRIRASDFLKRGGNVTPFVQGSR